MSRPGPVVRIVLVLVVGILVLACFHCLPFRPETAGSGPLHAGPENGGDLVVPPKGRTDWWVSFGAIHFLCATKPVTLTAIDLDWAVRPVESRVVIQTVVEPPSHGTTNIESAYGRAPEFDESYADPSPMAGTLTTDLSRARVTTKHSCAGRALATRPYTDVLFEFRSSARGASLRGATVHYRSEGNDYALKLAGWDMIACGTAIHDKNCDGYLRWATRDQPTSGAHARRFDSPPHGSGFHLCSDHSHGHDCAVPTPLTRH